MKKTIFSISALFVFVLSGCSAKKNSTLVKNETIDTRDTLLQTKLTNDCKAGNKVSCKELGDYFYDQAKYGDAANVYDYTCAKFWYIPACLRLAYMFENGTGVEKNESIARDIYKRACYNGDKESCKKIR
ncbi:Sel1 repeat-containing protein [Campylobacter hyointestinalis subsp. hyointestinalis]|uniref:beta-lactamase n=1 Tax=Campylobacter hyointestinalis subsp. hyointestinalis TaxID=91352 RepID=A0A0S4SYF3_CAMHY|nr:SEL1-like repeat protein [Campylobacter hyointestinalis]PPB51330.1 hypothetical protein CDQ68_07460 [Campylobacter hyointestinalis subsp. hyointestinalis]PPB54251.1 hypothetical protein CDQ67_08360 [Campylobacter hyointestinalis subsp. hyointestinalis]PPB65895.1 hypothetical protein CDQ75_08010 [Campylobacter hyointestinalis subsp. hyointestinalis]PPB68819.1 hypothetical protein CDQ77_07280 [Campylobacter hyointestinalis subsp. hyointestinalis]CUU85272.1 Sel1 repeat-containing protein [Camp